MSKKALLKNLNFYLEFAGGGVVNMLKRVENSTFETAYTLKSQHIHTSPPKR